MSAVPSLVFLAFPSKNDQRFRGWATFRESIGSGKPVGDTTEMLNLIAQLPPGEKAKMTVLRKSREAALDVVVGKRPIPKDLNK